MNSLSLLNYYKTVAVIILKSFIVEERCVITDSHCRPTAPLPSGTIKQTQKNKNRLLQEIQMQNTNTDTNTILKCLQDNQVDFQKNRSRPQREVTRIQTYLIDSIPYTVIPTTICALFDVISLCRNSDREVMLIVLLRSHLEE